MFARTTVYLGLGGNIGDAEKTITSVVSSIRKIPGIFSLRVSPYYETKPISDIPQNLFVNAVCKFHTSITLYSLFRRLEQIERDHGKVPKAKNEPRPIDIDILFYGRKNYDNRYLQVPHARWRERLFVLVPLADLTQTIELEESHDPTSTVVFNINKLISTFTDDQRREVTPLLSQTVQHEPVTPVFLRRKEFSPISHMIPARVRKLLYHDRIKIIASQLHKTMRPKKLLIKFPTSIVI